MKILITNDDGYNAKGIRTLVEILKPYGEIVVISPKEVQSGMSMSVDLGKKPIAVKKFREEPGVSWWYMSGTPSSCVKFGIDNIFYPELPDVVVSGINHGGNYGTAYCYSGTIGAASEAALAGIPTIAVSLDTFDADADFGVVEKLFPSIFERLLKVRDERYGVIYNVNFPYIPIEKIKGERVAKEAVLRWINEFMPYDKDTFRIISERIQGKPVTELHEPEEGEQLYMMVGDIVNDSEGDPDADYNVVKSGYIAISTHNLLSTDEKEFARLKELGFDKDF